jgi:hypothetical protein
MGSQVVQVLAMVAHQAEAHSAPSGPAGCVLVSTLLSDVGSNHGSRPGSEPKTLSGRLCWLFYRSMACRQQSLIASSSCDWKAADLALL